MKRFLGILLFAVFLFSSVSSLAEEIIFPEPTDATSVSLSSADENDLAEAYISNKLPHRIRLRIARPSGSKLTGANSTLYTKLKAAVTLVADGTNTSTEFTWTAEEIYGQDTFTADDLGVAYLRDDDGWNPEAIAAMQDIRNALEPETVIECLLQDCPYELYWRDDSYTYSTCGIAGNSEYLKITGDVTVRINVSADYALAGEDGEILPYQVDPRYGSSVQLAVDNAQAILDRYAELSDYEKLCAYRDEICELASYNHAAVNEHWVYGDPWQLVWVFDGKPSTQVVCEGYAKAFQYLCDLGTSSTEVISVQGYLGSVSALNAHMWNIVTIDGVNYIADLTSCDAGKDLFLRGYADGNAASGYFVRNGSGTSKYIYSDTVSSRTERELTLSRFDYAPGSTAGEAVLPAGLTTIEDEAFAGTAIEKVQMTEDVTEIADDAFQGIENQILIFAPRDSEAWKYAVRKGIWVK